MVWVNALGDFARLPNHLVPLQRNAVTLHESEAVSLTVLAVKDKPAFAVLIKVTGPQPAAISTLNLLPENLFCCFLRLVRRGCKPWVTVAKPPRIMSSAHALRDSAFGTVLNSTWRQLPRPDFRLTDLE